MLFSVGVRLGNGFMHLLRKYGFVTFFITYSLHDSLPRTLWLYDGEVHDGGVNSGKTYQLREDEVL